MFSKLFKRPHTILRHLSAPFLEERLRFLTHCAEYGAARRTLRRIANYQLIVIDYLKPPNKGSISRELIVAAANRWAQRQTDFHGSKAKPSSWSKACFITQATHWLGFLGRIQKKISPSHPYTEFINEFARFIREERCLSPEVVNSSCRWVEVYLAQFWDQQLSLSDLSITHIDDALLHCINQSGYARHTVKNHATALRAFFHCAEQRGWCQRGLADAIMAPRLYRHETLPSSPTWKDVQRLLAGTDGSRPADIRERAILLLLAVYGLRAGEVSRMLLDDLDWNNELLHIRHIKHGKTQQLPLSRTVGEAILHYLRKSRPQTTRRELFLTLNAPFRPLKGDAIGQIVQRRWKPLNVALEHHGAHSLRHACATRLINQGFSLKEIGDLLGHRHPETTRIYAKVDLPHLREVAEFNLGGLLCD